MPELKNGMLDFNVPIPEIKGASSLLKESFRIYISNFLLLVVIVNVLELPAILIGKLLDYALEAKAGVFLPKVVPAVAGGLIELATFALVLSTLTFSLIGMLQSGRYPPIRESFSWGFRRLPRVFLARLLFILLVLGGAACLIVPGILFSVRYFFVDMIASIEQEKRPGLFRRSKALAIPNLTLIYFGGLFLIGMYAVFTIAMTWVWAHTGLDSDFLFQMTIGFLSNFIDGFAIVLILIVFLNAAKQRPEVLCDICDPD